ncbi:sucrose nonfermenting 4-like protein [Asparagus officinalis]|uniref:sucrose nonfermenting 4-like protein n=1 Tax=Asparagus officinalis TaxID=4686 RepID=UPI00098E2C0A|nr:sucrose nonfermenting 4-like protein [Asparagus officinalis]
MVLTRFQWRYGGRQVFLCGSFSSWLEHYPMAVVEGSPSVFQTICDLQLGFHQYRFLVDGVWRCDEQQYIIPADHGMVNNVIFVEEPNILSPVPHYDPYVSGTMHVNDGLPLHLAPQNYMPPGSLIPIPDAEIQTSRRGISNILSNQTIYDILPVSSKVFVVGAQLPVKQAFHIMYEEGLAVVPIWDDSRATITGMLTASDFILILQELQKNERMLANEELEMHSVSAWKEGKLQLYRQCNGPIGLNLRPLIHVSDQDCLKDVALKILHNEISAVPIFRSLLPDSSCMPLLNVASLPVILKYITCHLGEVVGSVPILQHPVCRIPVGTWLPETGRGSGHHLAVLQQNASLSSALDLLLKGRISSIPVVDGSGSLIDVYSRSDIMALAKDDMYARIQLDQITMNQVSEDCFTCTFYL